MKLGSNTGPPNISSGVSNNPSDAVKMPSNEANNLGKGLSQVNKSVSSPSTPQLSPSVINLAKEIGLDPSVIKLAEKIGLDPSAIHNSNDKPFTHEEAKGRLDAHDGVGQHLFREASVNDKPVLMIYQNTEGGPKLYLVDSKSSAGVLTIADMKGDTDTVILDPNKLINAAGYRDF